MLKKFGKLLIMPICLAMLTTVGIAEVSADDSVEPQIITYADMTTLDTVKCFASTADHNRGWILKDSEGNILTSNSKGDYKINSGYVYEEKTEGISHLFFALDSETVYPGESQSLRWDKLTETDVYDANTSGLAKAQGRTIMQVHSGNANKFPSVDISQYPYITLRVKVVSPSKDAQLKVTGYNGSTVSTSSDPKATLDTEGWQVITLQLTPKSDTNKTVNRVCFTVTGATSDLALYFSKIYFSDSAIGALNLKGIEADGLVTTSGTATEFENVFVTQNKYTASFDMKIDSNTLSDGVSVTKDGEVMTTGYAASLSADAKSIIVQFANNLDFNSEYKITYKKTIRNLYGGLFGTDKTIILKTQAQAPYVTEATADNVPILTLTSGAVVNVSATVTTAANENPVWITAVYKNGTNEMLEHFADSDKSNGYSNQIVWEADWTNCYIKSFLWNSETAMGVLSKDYKVE